MLKFVALAAVASATMFDLWNATSATPALGFTASPASQTVISTTTSFQITAIVTDKDTYQRTVPPNDFQERAGAQGDIGIESQNPLNPTSTNISFDANTGARTEIYTWAGSPHALENSGDILDVVVKLRGKDNIAAPSVRNDQSSEWSDCLIRYQYVPKAEEDPIGPGG
jgi:hypothetical protein